MADLDVTAVVATASAWPGVEVGVEANPGSGGAGGSGTGRDATVRLGNGGRTFARVSPAGVELTLPRRVRDMLVETGRATALPSPARAHITPDDGGLIDLDLLLLAYERARVTTKVRSGEPPR